MLAFSQTAPRTRNPKHEIRNPKQTMKERKCPNDRNLPACKFSIFPQFESQICFGSFDIAQDRFSRFEFRICPMVDTEGLLKDASAHTLVAGDLEAIFLPSHGMLGASLRHRGVEILRRVENLETSAAKGSTAGIPLLHPWANRLAGFRYRAAGREVRLDSSSPLLHLDANGLPMHGVPWPLLVWELTEAKRDLLKAKLEWSRSDLLAIFPFRHRVEVAATLQRDSLTLETTLVAGLDGPVPVSFGFHPYFGLSELSRAQ
jgi:galactose mutarotase-like enzyme